MNKMRQAILHAALAPATLSASRPDSAEGSDSAEQQFTFSPDFLGFAGHFPGYPILPAILQTLMAQMVAEQLCGQRLVFQGLSRAKFTRELRPGEPILVKVMLREKDNLLRCSAELYGAEQLAASFTLTFAAGDPL